MPIRLPTALPWQLRISPAPWRCSGRPFRACRIRLTRAGTALNNAAVHIASTQCGTAGPPNNVYGWGRVDILAAAASATPTPTPTATPTATPTPTVQVTVQTSPAGLTFTVDGTTYSSTQTFSWASGSSHTIATTSPQSGGTGVQYVWTRWSDNGAISHTVAPTTNKTYTATFRTQYYLTMSSRDRWHGKSRLVGGKTAERLCRLLRRRRIILR